MNRVRKQQTTVAQSIAVPTKTPPLKPKPEINTRQSQMPKGRAGASPMLLQQKAKAAAQAEREANMDPAKESERLMNEITADLGAQRIEAVELEWANELDAKKREIDQITREERLLDMNILTTFEDAAKTVPMTEDVFGTVTAMMNAGFESLHKKMAKEKSLLERRMELMRQMRDEMLKHTADNYTADLESDTDLDSDDEPAVTQPQKRTRTNAGRF